MKQANLILAALLFLFSSCAATYKMPVTPKKIISKEVSTSDTKSLINKAKQVLIEKGFTIIFADDNTITTALKQVKLTTNDCDCGTTLGLNYLLDKKTFTEMAITVSLFNSTLKVDSNVKGEYLKGDSMQGVNMTCISKGTIEKSILDAIIQ